MKKILICILYGILIQGIFAENKEITVSAAASLTNAFREISEVYYKNTGTKVNLNFAASGNLLSQIEKGAPVDVFVSADQETADRGISRKVLDAPSRVNFVSNKLVLIVPSDSKFQLNKLEDILIFHKIAIGGPTVPVGRYTKEALEKKNLWKKLEKRFIPGDSVRQVLDYVIRNEVDAGFVYITDAAIAKDKVKVIKVMDGHKPILYPVLIVTDSNKKMEAKSFINFVQKDKEAREILIKYGFGNP